MTVTELREKLQKCEEAGLGDVEVGIPVDRYNEWINGVQKLQFRPFINAIAICDCNVECSGFDLE